MSEIELPQILKTCPQSNPQQKLQLTETILLRKMNDITKLRKRLDDVQDENDKLNGLLNTERKLNYDLSVGIATLTKENEKLQKLLNKRVTATVLAETDLFVKKASK